MGSTDCGVFAGDFIPIGIGHCPVKHLMVVEWKITHSIKNIEFTREKMLF